MMDHTVPFPARLRQCSRSLLVIPVAAMIVICVLAGLRLNGSSIGVLAAEADPSPQAAFDLRPIRSDEWHLRTPMVVRQAANDFARTSDVGMGEHDVGVLLDFPVRSYAAIVKPNSWAYFVVGVERAFAFEWWLTVFGPFLGVYAVLAVITRSRLISALSGLLATAAPVMAWWAVPWLGLTVLYGGLMAAMVIRAGQVHGRRRYVLFALGGWFAACCCAQLYLPWVIPVGLLFGAVAISQLTRSFKNWKQFLLAAAYFVGVFAVLLAVFYRAHHVALEAISNTVYPGRRRTPGAGGSPILMFDAPFDSLSLHGTDLVGGTNQSEASAGLMLWLPIALVGGGFRFWRSRSGTGRALTVTLTVSVVFAAWALLPVPAAIGGLLGLTSVQGSRMVVALTVASALAAGLCAHQMRTDASWRPSCANIAIASLAFVFVSGVSASRLSIAGGGFDRVRVIAILLVVGTATALLLAGRAAIGLGAMCALLLFSTARVNPLQVGLGPLIDNPLMHQVQALRRADPTARWAAANSDDVGFAVLAASGAPTVTGWDLYPVPQAWHLIDPTDAAETAWNRVANLDLSIDDTVAAPVIQSPQPDLIVITTPSCAGALQTLSVRYVSAATELSSTCLREVERPTAPGERWIYEVVSS